MSPDRDRPPADDSNGSAVKHLRAASDHLVTAIAVMYGAFLATVTARPPLDVVWHGLVGRRRKPSLLAVLAVPVTAGIVGPILAVTYGYPRVKQWMVGDSESLVQWVGGLLGAPDPHGTAIVGLLVFVAAAAAYAAYNSGLLPTIAVVMGPIIGIGLSRYGMMIEHFSPSKLHRSFGITAMQFETVGSVDALGTALFLATVWGIPIGIVGFALGTLGRRFSGLFGLRHPGNGTSG